MNTTTGGQVVKRLIVGLLVSIIAMFAVPARSHAAYMYLSECRNALTGNPSTNDNDVASFIDYNVRYFNTTEFYHEWADYYRYSDNRVHQNVRLYTWTGRWTFIRLTFECNDSNKTGQVSSAEDWAVQSQPVPYPY